MLQTLAGSRPIEILRKETLENLEAETAARVLNHGYSALLPITPLPLPPLPLGQESTGSSLVNLITILVLILLLFLILCMSLLILIAKYHF